MEMQLNLQLADLLNEWDPFCLKNGSYDPEIAETIQAVHMSDDPQKLAKNIRDIYEFSFEELIPIDSCLKIAQQLLMVKNNSSCSINQIRAKSP